MIGSKNGIKWLDQKGYPRPFPTIVRIFITRVKKIVWVDRRKLAFN